MQPNYDTLLPDGSTVTERQQRNRKLFITLGVVAAIALIAFYSISYFMSFKTVTIKPSNGVTMRFGTPSHGEDGANIDEELAKTSSEEKKVRVREGWYAVMYSGNGIKASRTLYNVTKNMVIEAPKTYPLTDEKLTEELSKQSAAINAVLKADAKTSAYTPQSPQLYEDGTWYAAKLVPADPVTQDTLVVILHKENGQWKLAVDPAITLFIGNYPHVPEQIIRDINNRTY